MQISAITQFTLIDFPREIACIVFTPGCNFRCGFCHNSEFVLPQKLKGVYKNLIPEESFFAFLEQRKNKLTWVSICGWEPTLQKWLFDFCKKVKNLWYKVKLDTNGRDPEILKKLIESGNIDYIAMDMKDEIGKFSSIAGVTIDEKPYLESIQVLLDSQINYEFRTTVIKWSHTKKSIENIAKYIIWAKNYYLQNYRSGNTLDPNFEWKSFSSHELLDFQQIAKKYVENCKIRI